MKKVFKRIMSLMLILSLILSTLPFLDIYPEAAVSSGINDMTALDALGIDISKAPLGYNPNTTDNPFGRETTSIAVIDELFMVGKSSNDENYSKLYGDNWAVGGKIDNFFSNTPSSIGDATNGNRYVLAPDYTIPDQEEVLGANALTMTEANLDMTRNNGGRKDSVAYVSYKFYNPGSEPRGTFSIGLIDPKYHNDGEKDLHSTIRRVLNDGSIFGNNEDKSGTNQFKNEYLASNYIKITSGDYDGDGIDEIAVYVPSISNPRIDIYKVSDDWKQMGAGTYLDKTMTYQLDRYKATKAVAGAVPTAIGDSLAPNMVSLVSADFDMDGIDDLAISYGYTGKAADSVPCKAVMLFGKKAGDFGSRAQEIPLSHNGTAIVRASFATGDIDGDGEKELVVGGSLATANFNPNERYVAVYKWNGSSFSVVQSKKFNLFEKDNSGNYINSNIPNNKTEFYSLAVAPANIAIGHFNGISEPVNIYIDSILIELGDNGMEIVSLLDDKLRTTSSDYVEWGARAAQVSGNGTDTLITMTSDVAHTTPTKKTFTEYFGEIIGKLNPSNLEKIYMKAVYGSDSGIKIWKNEVKGTGFCLPNTDKDSSTVRYTGEHYYTYIDPEILAVLASPPYFKDLFNGEIGGDIEPSSTTYGTTKGSGSGSSYSNTLSVGLYTSYEKSVSLFGVELFKAEAELEINNHMTWETLNTSTVEQSVTYETLTGQDTVVFFSMPIETYVYEQIYPVNDKDGNFLRTETQSMTVNIPHEASVKNLPLETYERIAADYHELPKISGNVLKHTVGLPSTYPSSTKGYGSSGVSGLPTIVSQGDPAKVGYGASSQTKEIAMTSSKENSFNYELDISTKIGAGAGGVMVGITAGYAHGAGTISISTSGSSYSATLYALPTAAEAYGYDFNWKLFTYPYKNENQVFPVVSYILSDIKQPPMVPDNFIQLEEGTTQENVALSWQYSGNPAGFTIYRYFRAAGSAGFYEVANVSAGDMNYVVDIDGNTRTYRYIDTNLTPDTEYLYRIQTVGNSQPSLSVESVTLTAYTKPAGIIPEVKINTDELIIYPDTEHIATVSIANADKLSGGTLFFQWKKYDSNTKKWIDLATLNNMSIKFTDAGLDDEGLYRCKVTSRQNTTIVSSYSPVLDVKYSKRTAIMVGLQAIKNGENGILSVKLLGSETKTIPSGTVVFKLESEGYSKQYAATINNQGIASVVISTVPGIYKVSADYNGNRVFKPNTIDKDTYGKNIFYVFGQEISGSYYWDYADSYTYGDSIEFTKYIMNEAGAVISTENINFSDAIAGGKNLWRQMELYTLPEVDGNGVKDPLLYKAGEYSGDNPYRPLVCNESESCTHGVENVLGDYLNTVIDRFKSSKAGWVGSYYIPYDLDGNGEINGYELAQNNESFIYSNIENPEGFYFTIDKAGLKVDFKDGYKDLVKSISEIELYEEKKVILTEDNYKDYGFTEAEWNIFIGPTWFRQSDKQQELLLDGEFALCKYSLYTDLEVKNEKRFDLTYSPLVPSGPGAQLAKNKNALVAKGQLFDDDPLETVAADEITDTGLFDKGYEVLSYKYREHGGGRFEDERLITYPVNLWAFEGHYYEMPGYDGNGDVAPFIVGKEESLDRPMDNYYPKHGLNVFRYDRFGTRSPITKYFNAAGQFILGVEPTYYFNSYKASSDYRLAYLRPHIAENYDITFGTASMTVTGSAHSVFAESNDITKGSVELVNPTAGISKKYPVGTQLIFVATPNVGFEVDYWEVNNKRTQDGGTQLKVIQIEGGISIKVHFKSKINTLNYMTEPEKAYVDGQLVENKIDCTIPSGKELMAGAPINMTATAAIGWHFIKWEIHTEGAATQYKEGINLKTIMPNTSTRIYGIFQRDSYMLTLGENLIALVGDKIIDTSKPIVGDTIITVKPAVGYMLTGEWSATEGVTDIDGEENTFTFKLLKNTGVSADTSSGTYKVTIFNTTGGNIIATGAMSFEEVKGGTALKFTATPKRGYKVQNWIINGVNVGSSSNTYNYVIDKDIEVSASFIEKTSRNVTVSVASGSHANLLYKIDDIDYSSEYTDGNITLYEDEILTITAKTSANEMVAGWSIDNNYNQSYENSYTIAYADKSKNIKVFTQSIYSNRIEFSTEYEGEESSVTEPTLTAKSDGINITSGSLIGAGKKLIFTFSGEEVSVSRWTIAYGGGKEKDILDEDDMPITDNVLEIPYTLDDAKIKAYYKLNSEFEEIENRITGIQISPTTANVQKGSQKQFTAIVKGTGDYDETVIWSVYGGEDSDTIIDFTRGVLNVGLDETATELTVTATANGDNSIKDTAKVFVIDEPVNIFGLTVIGGIGGGEYAEDEEVTIIANEPVFGKEFKGWKVVSGTLDLKNSTENPLTFQMPGENIKIEATYKDKIIIPKLYRVIVRDSYSIDSGEGEYEEGEAVYIDAGTRSNYSFDNWTSSDITVTNASSKNARFIMPKKDVIITANWVSTGSGGGGGSPGGGGSGGNSGSGGSDGGSNSSPSKVEQEKVKEPVINPKQIAFIDVSPDDYFADYIIWVYEKGLMMGTSDNVFNPHGITTRGMIVTILHRLEGLPLAGDNIFTDVKVDKYYSYAIAWATENKIVNGYGNGNFGPEDPITREQLAAILMNYAKFKGYDTISRADLSKFNDAEDISNWAKEPMSWANESLIQGDGINLMPNSSATRAQVATILYRFVEEFKKYQ